MRGVFECEPSVSYFAYIPLFTKCNSSRLRLPDCFIIFWFVTLVYFECIKKDEDTSTSIHPVLLCNMVL
jgi:hypothetical protein